MHSNGDCFCFLWVYLTKIWKYLVYIFTATSGFLRDHFKVLEDSKQIRYLILINWGQPNICLLQLCYHLYSCSVCACDSFYHLKVFSMTWGLLSFFVSVLSSCSLARDSLANYNWLSNQWKFLNFCFFSDDEMSFRFSELSSGTQQSGYKHFLLSIWKREDKVLGHPLPNEATLRQCIHLSNIT